MQAKEMIENIREAFISNLPYLDWMDSTTREAAIEKVDFFLTFYIFCALMTVIN